MRPLPLLLGLPLLALAAGSIAPRPATSALRCTMVAGPMSVLGTIADTLQRPLAAVRAAAASATHGLPPGPGAEWRPDSPMPTALVRVTGLNQSARDSLAAYGITDSAPTVLVQARPYGADCRTLLWTDSQPWVMPSAELQYFPGLYLAPRDAWIDARPTFVLQGGWQHPYPQRVSGMAAGLLAPPTYRELKAPLTRDSLLSAAELFAFDAAMPASPGSLRAPPSDAVLAWARANRTLADREPLRSRIRRELINADMARARTTNSAYAGTWRVMLSWGDEVHAWEFRTRAEPALAWRAESLSVLDLLDGAGVPGYSLSGYGAMADGSLPTDWRTALRPPASGPRVASFFLAVADPITTPGAAAATGVPGELRFQRRGAPEALWSVLDPWVEPRDTTIPWPSRLPPRNAGDDLVRLPFTLRQERGLWRAELRAGMYRVVVERISAEVLR